MTPAESGLIGLVGFEPTASWSRTRRSTKLSHSPKTDEEFAWLLLRVFCLRRQGASDAVLRRNIEPIDSAVVPEPNFGFRHGSACDSGAGAQNAAPENNLPAASTISSGSKLICGGVDEIR